MVHMLYQANEYSSSVAEERFEQTCQIPEPTDSRCFP
jgi:hypothetical protein